MFLLASFISGIGNTMLQAAVNPYITILGPLESAATRMSMMGIANKAAWAIAPIFLGVFLNLSDVKLEDIKMPFYFISGIFVVLGILVTFVPLPEVKAEGEDENDTESAASAYAANKISIWRSRTCCWDWYRYSVMSVLRRLRWQVSWIMPNLSDWRTRRSTLRIR